MYRADYTIDSVTESDSGTYLCIAVNPIGQNIGTITVTVTVTSMLSQCMHVYNNIILHSLLFYSYPPHQPRIL